MTLNFHKVGHFCFLNYNDRSCVFMYRVKSCFGAKNQMSVAGGCLQEKAPAVRDRTALIDQLRS